VASNITFEQEIEEKLKAQGFELSALSKDLKLYFDTNRAKKPKYIGKDTPYTRPAQISESEIHHIHIFVEGISCPHAWNTARTSDSYIVYTFGYFDEDAIRVIDFLSKDAHDRSKENNYSLMRKYKTVADRFRDKC
jgi:hypothetical protein